MLHTTEINIADTITESDITDFLTNAVWVVCSNYHTVLKTSPGAATFGRDMLFDFPILTDWSKIGEYRQQQTDKKQQGKTWPMQTGSDKVLLQRYGIFHKIGS